MPQGSFNFSRFVRELGLKNVAEMPVRETIQPVINLDVGRGQYPIHTGATAVAGGMQTGGVATKTVFQLHSLDPGGLVLNWIMGSYLQVVMTCDEMLTGWVVGPIACPAQHFTSGLQSISTLNKGQSIIADSVIQPNFTLQTAVFVQGFAPLYVPRGNTVRIITAAINQTMFASFSWTGITATQAEE